MKQKKLLEIIKSGNITIPLYLYRLKNNLEIDSDSFLFIMYLYNYNNELILFDPIKITKDLGINLEIIMNNISRLTDKKLISVDCIKNDKGIIEEFINLSYFYDKINRLVIDEFNNEDMKENDLFSVIEQEFGRSLSSMEYEIINAWLDKDTSEELVIEALKEAVMNGVCSLRYIDKILYEWQKKGYKNKADVDKSKIEYRRSKERKTEKKEVFDYNWLEDNDSDEEEN